MSSLDYFRMVAPQYATLSDADVVSWLSMANLLYEASCLNTNQNNLAGAYLAAHLISMNQLQSSMTEGSDECGSISSSEPIARTTLISEKEGDLQRSYANPYTNSNSDSKSGASSYKDTFYGKMFLQITAPCFGGGILTRV